MDILTYTLKWSEIILRWGHVLFAILWVGNSFLFNYLDNKLNKKISSKDIDGEGYLMHSGFFYKLTRLKKSPENIYLKQLVIFKWQSYLTFITGILLLFVIYYYNAGVLMVDKRVIVISPTTFFSSKPKGWQKNVLPIIIAIEQIKYFASQPSKNYFSSMRFLHNLVFS